MNGTPYWNAVPKAGATPSLTPTLSAEEQVVEAAIARGQEVALRLETARKGLFHHMRAVYQIAGWEGLRACVLGIEIAVQREFTGGKR